MDYVEEVQGEGHSPKSSSFFLDLTATLYRWLPRHAMFYLVFFKKRGLRRPSSPLVHHAAWTRNKWCPNSESRRPRRDPLPSVLLTYDEQHLTLRRARRQKRQHGK